MAEISMLEKKIQAYDSLSGGCLDFLEHLLQCLDDEHRNQKLSPLPLKDEWALIPTTRETPHQTNGKWLLVSLRSVETLHSFVTQPPPLFDLRM